MSNHFHLVIFDWEGTLADTLGQILHIVSQEARNLGLGDIDWEKARDYADLGLNKAIQKLFPEITMRQQEQLLASIQRAMIQRHTEVQLIPGARECLDKLQKAGVLLAVASNKGHASLQRAIASAGLESVFAITRSASQTAPKPDPQMLEEILSFCDISASQALMIGDSAIDMEMAISARVKAAGFDYYHQQTEALTDAGASHIFDNYQAVAQYLGL